MDSDDFGEVSFAKRILKSLEIKVKLFLVSVFFFC